MLKRNKREDRIAADDSFRKDYISVCVSIPLPINFGIHMSDHTVTSCSTHITISLKGRIDALAAPEIRELFTRLILEGGRLLAVDMTAVHYVSSAGLRSFISAQKELKQVGGEIVLAGLEPQVQEVFKVSGFNHLFRILPDLSNASDLTTHTSVPAGKRLQTDSFACDYHDTQAPPGTLSVIGAPSKMENASYTPADVITVPASGIRLGCGLAALGDGFDDYQNLFGEALVVDSNFFYYPAVRHSSVDFLLAAHTDFSTTYRFLHGFSVNGDYRYRLSFQGFEGSVGLTDLLSGILSFTSAEIIGISLLAESRGILGMNLKKSPLSGYGVNIFDRHQLPEWFDYPVEAEHSGAAIAAAGIVARNPEGRPQRFQALFPGGRPFHLHAAIFQKAPLATAAGNMDRELARVFNDLSALKVQHLMSRSRLGYGLAGIIEIGV